MGGMYGLNALLEFNHSPKCLVVAPVLTVSIMFFYAYAALLYTAIRPLKWYLGRLKLFAVKVRQFQNEFMKSSFLPKYKREDFCPHYTGQKS